MELFNEIDDLNDLFLLDKNSKLDSKEGYEDLQSKYSCLHESYSKEIENSKKVEKSLLKCLKFYSKLSKKYEEQQKIISNLEESIREKVKNLEEAQKNEEKLKGLIQVYSTERNVYAGQTTNQLRKDKELLIDIFCKVIKEIPSKTPNIRQLSNLVLKKFRKDLDDDNLTLLLKIKNYTFKEDFDYEGEYDDFRMGLTHVKHEDQIKSESKYSCEFSKGDIKKSEDDVKDTPLDLTVNSYTDNENSELSCNESSFAEEEQNVLETPSSPPTLKNLSPTLKSICSVDKEKGNVLVNSVRQTCDLNTEHRTIVNAQIGSNETSEKLIKSHSFISVQKEECTQKKNSIFDISGTTLQGTEKVDVMSDSSDIELEFVEVPCNPVEKDEKPDEKFIQSCEEEMLRIFNEMTSFRVLSPIRDLSKRPYISNLNKKRTSTSEENLCKVKKFKEEKPGGNLLDSIMSAMSIQNEEFKGSGCVQKDKISESGGESPSKSPRSGLKVYTRRKTIDNNHLKENSNTRQSQAREQTIEKIVTNEIKNFVAAPISCKEDADKYVGHCLSVISNKSEDVIAKCIVTLVLENVDEPIEIFERPSPPLTKTQHRLIVLLSVFRTLDSNFDKISAKILSLIWDKLLPDNFFWPDDSVEAAVRFYAALCKAKNDTKTLWRFCLHVMTEMRQRCPLVMFTVLKTWPDALHDSTTLKSNILALTIVNIFLHMPKKEGLRNLNQDRKLAALKHLLMNFYQFKVEDTIENYAKKMVEAVSKAEPSSEKALVLLSKCRDPSWTVKHLVSIIKSSLNDWREEKVDDCVASRFLSVMKQICSCLQEENVKEKAKDFIVCVTNILNTGRKTHELETSIIEILLELKQYPEARKVIREWIPKKPIPDSLRNEIINVSAVNILRELKLNRKKEPKNNSNKKKSKKQSKKNKAKKKKNQKMKNERKERTSSSSVSS